MDNKGNHLVANAFVKMKFSQHNSIWAAMPLVVMEALNVKSKVGDFVDADGRATKKGIEYTDRILIEGICYTLEEFDIKKNRSFDAGLSQVIEVLFNSMYDKEASLERQEIFLKPEDYYSNGSWNEKGDWIAIKITVKVEFLNGSDTETALTVSLEADGVPDRIFKDGEKFNILALKIIRYTLVRCMAIMVIKNAEMGLWNEADHLTYLSEALTTRVAELKANKRQSPN